MQAQQNAVTASEPSTSARSLLGLWALALGLAAAGFQVLTGVTVEAVAITIAAAASCYLAAAALDRPWIAWAGLPASALVVVIGELAGITWWLGLGLYAVALSTIGLWRHTRLPFLGAQVLAMAGFGGIAVGALLVSPRVGLALAGVTLVSHAGWDYVHWRRNTVVPRSLAEFCFGLDIPFGVVAIGVALAG